MLNLDTEEAGQIYIGCAGLPPSRPCHAMHASRLSLLHAGLRMVHEPS